VRLKHHILVLISAAALLDGSISGRAEDEIRTYTVPKERAVLAQATAAPDSTMPAADIPVSSAPIKWTTPSGWEQLAATSIRLGNFLIRGQGGAQAEMAVFSFPGSVGTELGNVNRWRGELKLEPITESQINSQPVTIDGAAGKLYDISSETARTIVALLPHGGSTWFFKMRGDKNVVAGALAAFHDFLNSVHFSTAAEAPANVAVDNVATAPAGSGNGEPQFSVPTNWTETTPGPMLFKSYTASSADGKMAKATVSFFPGDVGGEFANINRWRGQMGLAPISESQLGSVTQSIDTSGGKVTLVDFTGTDGKTGLPGRLVAVMLRHGDNTWFYKLTGDGAAVESQKETFLKFVQSVRYP